MAKNIWVDHFCPFWTPLGHFGTLTSLPCLALLLILSARDDLVKVSWKSDAGKCQNQLTPPYFDQLSERHQPLWIQQNIIKLKFRAKPLPRWKLWLSCFCNASNKIYFQPESHQWSLQSVSELVNECTRPSNDLIRVPKQLLESDTFPRWSSTLRKKRGQASYIVFLWYAK